MQLQTVVQTPVPATKDASIESADVEILRGQLQQLQAALRSHTEVRRTLEESEVRYRELFERVQTGIYRVSVEGNLLLANTALLQMFGLADLTSARSVESFYLKASGRRAFLEEIEKAGEITGQETSYRRRDGSIVQVRESARAIRDSHGRTLYYEGVIEDLTPLRRSETLGRDSHHILQSLGENRPLVEVLTEVCEMVARQWTGSASLIFRRGEHGPFLLAECNWSAANAEAAPRHDVLAGALSDCAVSGVPCVLPDLEPAQAEGFRCAWSVPIFSGEQALLGCLTVLHRFSRAPEPEELLSLETAARLAALAVEQQKLQNDLDHVAHYDSLTEIPNRHLLQERIEMALAAAHSSGERVALISLGIDHFKLVNDRLGHRYGDTLLRAIATKLGEAGIGAFLARSGGDEFAILKTGIPKTGIQPGGSAEELAARAVELCAGLWPCLDQEVFVTASAGVAIYPDDASDAAELQRHADSAMHLAKERGRGAFQRFQKARTYLLQQRVCLEHSLRQALERSEFELYYQPQVDSQARLCGLEALLRWNQPQTGLILPAHFLPVAEQSGLIVPIGEWVIGEAARQLALWRQNGVEGVPVSVNVSALQLYGAWLPGIVEKKLHDCGVPADRLSIELTESLVMRNSEEATEQLKAIRKLGMQVAIDDFGTGYSSLSYLQQLPVDVLKIDRSFVECLGHNNERGTAVIRAILGLARTFQLQVIAEGVETPEQFRELTELGVNKFQGYLFGRPMPASHIAPLLANPGLPLRA